MCKIERIGRIRRAGRPDFAALEIKTAKCVLKKWMKVPRKTALSGGLFENTDVKNGSAMSNGERVYWRGKMKGFLVMYFILKQCYELCGEESLGIFLGEISPELWGNGMPIDRALLDDWISFFENRSMQKDCFTAAIRIFLCQYEGEGGFDFSHTKRLLPDIPQRIYDHAVLEMKRMYSSFQYDF
jgi:hypothetical protein